VGGEVHEATAPAEARGRGLDQRRQGGARVIQGVEDSPVFLLDQLDALADRKSMEPLAARISLLGVDPRAIRRECVARASAVVHGRDPLCAVENTVRGPQGDADCARQIVRLGSRDAGCKAAGRHRDTPHWYGPAVDT
jgi:hypothetical protein